MRTHSQSVIIKSLVLGLTLAATTPVLVARSRALGAETTTAIDRARAAEHLTKHQTYPATRAELLAPCNNLMEFSAAEKQWFAARLPEGTYATAEQVLKAVYRK